MERHKSLFLVFLVVLSLFLSYKLIFDKPELPAESLDVDETEIICYKRLYQVKPNRELLVDIPNRNINALLLASLMDGAPKRIGDDLVSSDIKDSGYLVISAFDVPVGMLFTTFKEKLPRLEFESFDRCFFGDSGNIFLQTDKGVFEFPGKYKFSMSFTGPEAYVELDERFMPTRIVGVNYYADLTNPVDSYIGDDRLQLANGFLKDEVAEIREEDSYLFASDHESLRIYQNGNIHYLSVAGQKEGRPNLHETLKVLRAFIKKVPVNFSNYRILSLYESEDTTLIYLSTSRLPYFASKDLPIIVNISGGKVTNFSYNCKFIKDEGYLFVEPDAKAYRDAFKENSDPILIYTEDGDDSKRAILSTMDTR